ncbi:hypothetical protein K505DRAFT_379792 [Melanomma pulvis-pyrius CBS 109.77]|uniref:Uncharacterized protein n=1 Tax=Melanomma pulvis-pyrius CBS 109.77 TaxID=1314802 RepID=A0A6A6WT95_9PLEO|nr:hypothetical protein K505DRAFT_379792 [Melanomma pulvis-pyrius CBS 109.77]
MATEETVQLSEEHAPQQASIDAFSSVLESVKHELLKIRHEHDKHEPEYFAAVKDLSNTDLASFDASNLEAVRAGSSAYGLHIFGKVKIPAAENAYIHIRLFGSAKEGTDGSSTDEREYKLHSIHTEEVVKDSGDHVFRAIFGKNDALEWFET